MTHVAVQTCCTGGGLTLALMQRLAHEGLGLPAALGLMAPWCDLRNAGDTLTTLTGIDPVLQYDQNLAGPALDYVGGDAARLTDPLVSPLLADYGNGRPFLATLIQVGSCLSIVGIPMVQWCSPAVYAAGEPIFAPPAIIYVPP
jgi:acetyl esterase/lipase